MKSLTGLDATFLYLETPEMPMHVGSLNLCELPAGFKGSFHKAVTQHIAKRMHLARCSAASWCSCRWTWAIRCG